MRYIYQNKLIQFALLKKTPARLMFSMRLTQSRATADGEVLTLVGNWS